MLSISIKTHNPCFFGGLATKCPPSFIFFGGFAIIHPDSGPAPVPDPAPIFYTTGPLYTTGPPYLTVLV